MEGGAHLGLGRESSENTMRLMAAACPATGSSGAGVSHPGAALDPCELAPHWEAPWLP